VIEVLETGNMDEQMVYASVDETSAIKCLFHAKAPTGEYFDGTDKGRCVGFHWLLHPIAVAKLLKRLR
jgi:hypothetical protein